MTQRDRAHPFISVFAAALASGAACGGPPPPVEAPIAVPSARPSAQTPSSADPWASRMVAGVALPYAVNVLEMTDAPIVSVRGAQVYADGTVVDDAASMATGSARLRDALAEKRKRSEASAKGDTFTGVVLLQLPQDLALGSVVSIVHAVVRAGYTNPSFMVNELGRRDDAPRIARLPVDAFLPAAALTRRDSAVNEDDADAEKVLHIQITHPEKYELLWKQGDTVVSTLDVPRADEQEERSGSKVYKLPALSRKVQSEWSSMGVHRDVADASFDRAVIHLDPTATHAYVVGVIDAVLRSHRPTTADSNAKALSAFRVALAEPNVLAPHQQELGRLGTSTLSITVRQGNTTVNGRLPPEVIQRIVRQNFGRFRLCYENGLRTNPKLAGRVAVKFTIDGTGSVSTAADDHSSLSDPSVVSCIARGFGNLSFPQPESGDVKVRYEVILNSD